MILALWTPEDTSSFCYSHTTPRRIEFWPNQCSNSLLADVNEGQQWEFIYADIISGYNWNLIFYLVKNTYF